MIRPLKCSKSVSFCHSAIIVVVISNNYSCKLNKKKKTRQDIFEEYPAGLSSKSVIQFAPNLLEFSIIRVIFPFSLAKSRE